MEKITFSFGKNWERFLKNINDTTIDAARNSLIGFLELPDLAGKTFLDIGCGSGLFSYAAYQLGAKKIVSFDADVFSVQCCKFFHDKAKNPAHWNIFQGSILDPGLRDLGMFDIVYAWGVLHHTGSMWEAIRNAAGFVKPGGYFYVALYNKVPGRMGSRFWFQVKKFYNRSPGIIKKCMEWLYILWFSVGQLMRFKNPLRKMKNHSKKRGMNWLSDVRDWLGGYPYEYASVEEVFLYIKSNFPDFELTNIIASGYGLGNNSFLFKRKTA